MPADTPLPQPTTIQLANTPEAQQFLVKGQATCLGGRHENFSNVVFLNIFDDGRAYTEGEHRTWLTAAGFAEIARVPLPEGVSIMTARKHV